MSQATQQIPERAEATPANRLIPYWPDGHWEANLDTADVMDRIQAFGPVPHRTLEVAHDASNQAISAAVARRAAQWDYDPASSDDDMAVIDPALPCAQGHAGSATQGEAI